jgi:single-strand DNA-binding protein
MCHQHFAGEAPIETRSARLGTIRWPHRNGTITWPKRPSDGPNDSFAKIASLSLGFLGQNAETRYTTNGTPYTRFSIATSVSWKMREPDGYNTRTEWHRVISWNYLGRWAANLQKGACVEVEGELRYREFTPAESDRNVRVAEVYASSILLLDRSDRQPASEAANTESVEEPTD